MCWQAAGGGDGHASVAFRGPGTRSAAAGAPRGGGESVRSCRGYEERAGRERSDDLRAATRSKDPSFISCDVFEKESDGWMRGQMAELRAAGKSDEAEHAKVTEEVQRELVALASQHREVVAALEERSSEVNSLMVRLFRSCRDMPSLLVFLTAALVCRARFRTAKLRFGRRRRSATRRSRRVRLWRRRRRRAGGWPARCTESAPRGPSSSSRCALGNYQPALFSCRCQESTHQLS